MIANRAPGEAPVSARTRALRNQMEIGAAVIVAEKHRQAAIAALGDMMRDPGQDETYKKDHRGTAIALAGSLETMHCTTEI